jgi:hypothetical protein
MRSVFYCIIVVSIFINSTNSAVYCNVIDAHYNSLDAEIIDGLPENWIRVPSGKYVEILQFLLNQYKGNVSKFKTFGGIYNVEYTQYLEASFMANIGVSSSQGGFQIQKFDLEFAIDNENHRIFRKKTIKQNAYKKTERATELFNVKNVSGQETTSIMENDSVTIFNHNPIAGAKELPGYPDLSKKKIARKVPLQQIKYLHLAEYIDPLEPLEDDTWGNVGITLAELKSKDQKRLKKMSTTFFIYETSSKPVWYMTCTFMDDKTYNRKLIVRDYWSETAGFNPVGLTWREIQSDKNEKLVSATAASWKKIDNVFVPEKYFKNNYPPESKNLGFSRLMEAKHLYVNTPLNENIFKYSALGLRDDDYLLDEINRKVFTIQNDQPIYLAKFYKKPQTPRERRTSQVRLFLILTGFALIALGIYLKIRRRRIENNKK